MSKPADPLKLSRWKPQPPDTTEPITVALRTATLAKIRKLAEKHGMAPEAYLAQFIEFAALK